MTLEEFYKATEGVPKDVILLHCIDGEIEEIEYDSECNEIIIW